MLDGDAWRLECTFTTSRQAPPAARLQFRHSGVLAVAAGRTARRRRGSLNSHELHWIANYIWSIADDVLRDLYVRGKYRA